MNKTIRILAALVALAFATGLQAQKKILIAYYSLHNGNTRIVAEHIQKEVGGTLFRIETIQTYPADYETLTAQAKTELAENFRPPLKSVVVEFGSYDTIYLGSPVWWGTVTPAVMSFLGTYNFDGKTVIPFITHEGSRLGRCVDDIRRLAPKATVLDGLAIRGDKASAAAGDVKQWLKKLGQLK